MSWECSTTPVELPDGDPTSHLVFDSTKVDAGKLKALEDLIYGTAEKESSLPTPTEVITLMAGAEG
jgi:hypothetical protein